VTRRWDRAGGGEKDKGLGGGRREGKVSSGETSTRVDRTHPDASTSKLSNVIQLRGDTSYISSSSAVRVTEGGLREGKEVASEGGEE